MGKTMTEALAGISAELSARKEAERVERERKAARQPIIRAEVAMLDATAERIAQAGQDNSALDDATLDKAGDRKVKVRRFSDSQIDRMFKAKRITYAQWFAAGWYLEQYEQSGLGGRVVANYTPATSRTADKRYGLPSSERQYRARQMWRIGRALIPDNMLKLVDDVVLQDSVPAFRNGQQGKRFGTRIGRALQPMAEWINAPEQGT